MQTGDLNQDGRNDINDLSKWEHNISNYYQGYYMADLNGEGNVDLLVSPMLEQNIENTIRSLHP